jgi:hypothetical protein
MDFVEDLMDMKSFDDVIDMTVVVENVVVVDDIVEVGVEDMMGYWEN